MSVRQILNRLDHIHAHTFSFDTKLGTNHPDKEAYYHQFANAIARLAQQYQLSSNLIVEEGNPRFLTILQSKAPSLRLFLVTGNFSDALKTATENNFEGITMKYNVDDRSASPTSPPGGVRGHVMEHANPTCQLRGYSKELRSPSV